MINYRCPVCRQKFFEADGPLIRRVEVSCRRCKSAGRRPIVVPVAESEPVFQRTCRCRTCRRVQIIDCPVDESMVCMVCGTRTLEVEEEVRPTVPNAHERPRKTQEQTSR